ncbi:MAG: MFS transporter [Proteobacteria bacterium]|nr:MFS transporter [Pseudomonadota bacterium]
MASLTSSARLPATIWVVGFVSLLMDTSSEIIHALLPLFLTTGLGASVAVVGLIDGVGESTAAIAKVFSGYLSDRIGRRKPLILIGYGLAALSKPLFALAPNPLVVFTARFADRVGKGLRGAPRDALVADVTPESMRGRAYGLRQALDTTGAFAGPLLAIALMALFADNMRAVFWIAVIPAAASVALVLVGLEDRTTKEQVRAPIRLQDLSSLSRSYWLLMAVSVMFTFARFSEAFLVLKANAEGLPLMFAPLVLVVMNFVYAFGAYPAGAIADRTAPRSLLMLGIAVLIAADLLLGLVPELIGAFAGIVLWGAHLALTQGLFSKLVADAAPERLRASAFGIFNLLTGLSLLVASVLAGQVWVSWGSAATFLVGALLAAAAALGAAVSAPRRP